MILDLDIPRITEQTYQKIMGQIEFILLNPNTGDKYRNMSDEVHARKALDWLLKIKPSSTYPVRIAAYGHDIERAVAPAVNPNRYSTDMKYRQAHSRRGADILHKLLYPHQCRKEISFSDTDLICRLVINHEIGGLKDVCQGQADYVRDADILANFEWADSESAWQSYPHRKLKSMLRRKLNTLLPSHKRFVQEINFKHNLIEDWIKDWIN